jgi:hypothetical protein
MKVTKELTSITRKLDQLGRHLVMVRAEIDRLKELHGVFTCIICHQEFKSAREVELHQKEKHPQQWMELYGKT